MTKYVESGRKFYVVTTSENNVGRTLDYWRHYDEDKYARRIWTKFQRCDDVRKMTSIGRWLLDDIMTVWNVFVKSGRNFNVVTTSEMWRQLDVKNLTIYRRHNFSGKILTWFQRLDDVKIQTSDRRLIIDVGMTSKIRRRRTDGISTSTRRRLDVVCTLGYRNTYHH